MALNKAAALALSTSLCGALILGTAGAATAAVAPADHTPAASSPIVATTPQQRETARNLDEVIEALLAGVGVGVDLDLDRDADRTATRTAVEARLTAALAGATAGGRTAAPEPEPEPAAGRVQGAAEPTPDPTKVLADLRTQIGALVKALMTGDWSKARQSFDSLTKLSDSVTAKAVADRSAAWAARF